MSFPIPDLKFSFDNCCNNTTEIVIDLGNGALRPKPGMVERTLKGAKRFGTPAQTRAKLGELFQALNTTGEKATQATDEPETEDDWKQRITDNHPLRPDELERLFAAAVKIVTPNADVASLKQNLNLKKLPRSIFPTLHALARGDTSRIPLNA